MHINKIRQIAKQMNVKTSGLKKTDIIRAVQRSEHNIECFATDRLDSCGENSCLWREDCISANNRS